MEVVFDHVYRWKKLGERKGHPCAVLVRGKMNSVLIMFEDGFKMVTSRYAVRRSKVEIVDATSHSPQA